MPANGAPHTQRPDVLTLVVGSMCLGAVFNDPQVMLAGDGHDLVHWCRVPKEVDRYNGFSPVGDGVGQAFWIHHERVGQDISKFRQGTHGSNCRDGGYRGIGDGNDFVPGFYPI